MSTADVLDVPDFGLPVPAPAVATATATTDAPDLDDANLDLRTNLERLERALVTRALELAGGNRAEAARRLGIRRALLYARMKHLGLEG